MTDTELRGLTTRVSKLCRDVSWLCTLILVEVFVLMIFGSFGVGVIVGKKHCISPTTPAPSSYRIN